MPRRTPPSAHACALTLLTARSYTARDLRRKLEQKGFDSTEIGATIERLTQSGLIDDARFASDYARQRLARGTAARRVTQELARKGIQPAIAGAAVAVVADEEQIDPTAAMEELARKKLRAVAALDADTQRRRVFGFLARRGYELEDIKRVIARVFP